MKNKLAILALSGTMLLSGAAVAVDCDPSFYIGVEGQANKYKGVKKMTDKNGLNLERLDKKPFFGKNGAGVSLVAGSRLNENLGVELGATGLSRVKYYTRTNNNSSVKVSNLRAKSHNLYADAMGYLPVSEQIDLIGSVGAGRLTSKVNGSWKTNAPVTAKALTSDKVSLKSSKVGARVGAGIGYKIDKNLSARLMVRHQKGNKFIKNVTSAGLGLLYQF